jgi:hypothetical protein
MTSGTPKLSEVARHLVIPEGIVSTAWPAVRDTCRSLGIVFDLWQDGAGRLIVAKRADGLYAADDVVLSIPRQVGKTFLIGWIIFALCIIRPGLTVIWTAHRYKTASETYESMRAMARRPKMRPHIDKVPQGAGNQAVIFRNGSRILFGARERGFGRGFTKVDILVFDEAQILTDNAIDDMVPATNHSANPLVFFMGTPPKPTDPSEVFSRHRAEALSGEATAVVYIELSADKDADPLDRSQWRKANPSFPSRTSERAMLRMRKNLTEDAFLREGLGVWDDRPSRLRPVPVEDWQKLATGTPPVSTLPVFYLTITPGQRAATWTAATIEDGRAHVEVASHRDGTGWIAARGAELLAGFPGAQFATAAAGPGAAMVAELERAGVTLDLLPGTETARGCALLERGVRDATLTHSGDPLMLASLAGAATRQLSEGGWIWDWKKSTSDVSLIAGVSGALQLLEMHRGYNSAPASAPRAPQSAGLSNPWRPQSRLTL